MRDSPQPPSSRAVLLRALERLRSGLPPDEIAHRITVGPGGTDRAARRLLEPESPTAMRSLAVLGPYGAGKTHTLTLFRDTARELGYATCFLSADNAEGALNHPQRAVTSLLATMEFAAVGGYATILTSLVERDEYLLQLADIVNDELAEDRRIGGPARERIVELLSDRGTGDAVDLMIRRDGLVRMLSGELLAALPATDNVRVSAYRLLAVAARAVSLVGAAGLLIVIDEVESIFTKLNNRLSRRGAVRTLSAFTAGLHVPSLRFVLGMTPDTLEGLHQVLREHSAYTPCALFERMGAFSRILEAMPLVRCHALTPEQVVEVLSLVRDLHRECYDTETPAAEWQRVTRDVLRRRPPVRLAIRTALDCLDHARFVRSTSRTGAATAA